MRNEDEIHFMDQRVVFDRRRMQQRARAGTSNTDTSANTDTDADTDANTDANTDADADADAENG